ncbi:MAG: polyprenol monophosphomannose synthase [Nitrospinota bacterium]
MKNLPIEISVVIPTYNEAKTIAELIEQISLSFKDSDTVLEFIVVDDSSTDDTVKAAESIKEKCNVKVIVRKDERGLATAVIRGWREASGRLFAVIDGDMQHPPEVIPHLFHDLNEHNADMAVASRKVAGGGTSNWESHRIIISSVATVIAKLCLPITLRKVRDATTGCFMFKRECVDLSKLSPLGFKIFLEVLARGKFGKIVEIPYVFNQRSKGVSKMTFKQDALFILHLLKIGAYTGELIVPVGIALTLAAFIAFLLHR